jgi:hypothetical protein
VTESVFRSRLIQGVHYMPESHSRPEPSILPIERPRCPKCQNRMMLAIINRGPARYDIRTFDCPKCTHTITVPVAHDPMKSDKAGWIKGELKAPG